MKEGFQERRDPAASHGRAGRASVMASPHAHDAIMPGNIPGAGAGGKGLSSHSRDHRRRRATRAVAAGALLALAGCIPPRTGAIGRWIGPLTPLAGTCDPAAQAVLIVSAKSATFAPDGGVLLLHGRADPMGHVTASLQASGMNHQPYVLSFDATLQDGHIAGTYLTPRCRASVTLSRG